MAALRRLLPSPAREHRRIAADEAGIPCAAPRPSRYLPRSFRPECANRCESEVEGPAKLPCSAAILRCPTKDAPANSSEEGASTDAAVAARRPACSRETSGIPRRGSFTPARRARAPPLSAARKSWGQARRQAPGRALRAARPRPPRRKGLRAEGGRGRRRRRRSRR